MTKDMEKATVLNAAFALVFTCKTCLRESQVPEITRKVWNAEDLSLVEEDHIRNTQIGREVQRT